MNSPYSLHDAKKAQLKKYSPRQQSSIYDLSSPSTERVEEIKRQSEINRKNKLRVYL